MRRLDENDMGIRREGYRDRDREIAIEIDITREGYRDNYIAINRDRYIYI